jgi:CheY-like chemotaxis protein/CHASE3 domain sensor protein
VYNPLSQHSDRYFLKPVLMKLSLGKKIIGGFIICSVILLLVAVMSLRNSENLVASNEWVNHTHEVLHALDEVLVGALNAETGERGYIITGEQTYLQPFNAAETELADQIARVRQLTRDNPLQQENIARIEKLADTLLRHLERCIAIRKSNDLEQTKTLVATGEGKRLLDALRREINNADRVEQNLLVERKQASDSDTRSFSSLFILLIIVIGVVLISVYFVITSNLKALKKAEQETAYRNWTLTGSGQLIKDMQGNKRVAELAGTIISCLANWMEAQGGALYTLGEDSAHLRLAGSYALAGGQDLPTVIRIGEGLAGQCAAERKTILVADIPAGQLLVPTAFGKMRPAHIIAVPVLFESAIIAVIELGSIQPISARQQEYLEIVVDTIGVAINSAHARERMEDLLEETQRQAEELQVQQEELKQTNEELHEKSELLERSEAELKAQQEELQQTNEELEEKAGLLEEQKGKLEMSKKDVETKAGELELTSKYKSEFLANMSHELRTPLNSILILSQLLTENKNKVLGEKEVNYAKNIYGSGNDLLQLINEILDLSKVESGKMEFDIAETGVGEIVANLKAMFGPIAGDRSIHFGIHYPADKFSTPLHTDRQRVEQILRNLLSNAFKFTEKNGRVQLEVEVVQAGEFVAFSVTDTGIGIPESKQELVFQAFRQADGSTKRKYGGTGLGLSISRELAHALGGDIRLQSEEGKGSRFTLYLPWRFVHSGAQGMPTQEGLSVWGESVPGRSRREVVEREAVETQLTHSDAQTAVPDDDRYTIGENDRVILIIEDDAGFAGFLLDFFRERNYKGIVAYQGSTGLSLARHYRPDAIVLDLNLPVMDGSEVLRKLKNDPSLRHIPVQIFSGYDRRKESLELGAFDFIRKPVTQPIVQEAVERMEEFTRKKLKKLLIVEDNRQQNNAIRELVGNGDVKSYSAYGGGEAYDLMGRENFDCIIIDLGLPDMSGIQLLEKIKTDSRYNRIPVIVYTGKDLTREEVARLGKLADTVVLKTANSKERLLDETTLFLHRVESRLPKEKQQMIRHLHRSDEVLKNRKILIVDDDMRNIYSLTNALEEEGLRCLTAENGRDALAMLKANPDTELVLMDVMMPEMDGYEATREIRKIEEFGKLPVIALTAKAMKGDREKCLEAGMSDYIAKPVDIHQLLSLMRVWLYR